MIALRSATIRTYDGDTNSRYIDIYTPTDQRGVKKTVTAFRRGNTLTLRVNGVVIETKSRTDILSFVPLNGGIMGQAAGPSAYPLHGKNYGNIAVQGSVTDEEILKLEAAMDYISGRTP